MRRVEWTRYGAARHFAIKPERVGPGHAAAEVRGQHLPAKAGPLGRILGRLEIIKEPIGDLNQPKLSQAAGRGAQVIFNHHEVVADIPVPGGSDRPILARCVGKGISIEVPLIPQRRRAARLHSERRRAAG